MGHNRGKIKDWRFYDIWRGMKYRCSKPYKTIFKYYGGRGIQVSKEWLNYDNFHVDMYESYTQHIKDFDFKNTSIDRINPNGNYEKENCRWATKSEQSRNQRNLTKPLSTVSNV